MVMCVSKLSDQQAVVIMQGIKKQYNKMTQVSLVDLQLYSMSSFNRRTDTGV